MDVYKEWLAIPEGERPPDHYTLLRCVQFEDDLEKIRAHYKKLNAHVRTYATGQYSEQSQDLLNELAKAMLCLTDPERKRDYDESLGREFAPEVDEFGRLPLLDVLVEQGHISRDQKKEVEEFAERRGLSERDAVVQMKLVNAKTAAQALARQLGFTYVDLEDMLPEDSALDMVPRNLVKRHSILPLFVDDDRLLVACVDEPEHELEEELRLRFGVPVRPVLSTPRSINQAIAKYYAPGARDEAVANANVSTGGGRKKSGGKAKEPAKAFSELSDEEKQQRKNLGILFMCWAFVLPMLPLILRGFVPQLLAYPVLASAWYLVFITVPVTVWWVTQ
ncbi:MAG: hypothetical protein ACF8TS_05880, partial [Maioricimonas sp. JB049]